MEEETSRRNKETCRVRQLQVENLNELLSGNGGETAARRKHYSTKMEEKLQSPLTENISLSKGV